MNAEMICGWTDDNINCPRLRKIVNMRYFLFVVVVNYELYELTRFRLVLADL